MTRRATTTKSSAAPAADRRPSSCLLYTSEAVIIATPNDLHLGVAREAVKRNIVPLVEKPISTDLEDAQAFAAEAETAGVPVRVGQHRRHNPFVNKAKEIIESGELGKLTVSSFHYLIYKNCLLYTSRCV